MISVKQFICVVKMSHKKLKNPDTKLMLDFENPQAQYPVVIDFVTVDT